MAETLDIFDARIKAPFGMVVSGPPLVGKTTFCLSLIKQKYSLIDKPIDYIIWFYGEYNDTIRTIENTFQNEIITVRGLPENLDAYIQPGKYGLHIYDDLMIESVKSSSLTSLISKKCHHCSVSWILILQNLFYEGKERKTILRCSHYLVIFNNPIDKSMPYMLAKKIMPRNQRLFLKIFEMAADRSNGYLFVDGSQKTPPQARLRSDIFEGFQRVYIPSL